jgi:DNA-binding transcriptional regulator YiaG
MSCIKHLIKTARLKQSLLIREIAALLHVDPALVSKWEKGTIKLTRV